VPALCPKADMFSAEIDVCFVQKRTRLPQCFVLLNLTWIKFAMWA
jgi:hypothetical protein